MCQWKFLTRNELSCHDDTNRMNLNEPRSRRGSGPIAQSGSLNPNLRITVAAAPAQQRSNTSEISEP